MCGCRSIRSSRTRGGSIDPRRCALVDSGRRRGQAPNAPSGPHFVADLDGTRPVLARGRASKDRSSPRRRALGPAQLQIVDLLRAADPLAARNSIEAFVDSISINWLIAGTDGHAKNTSFLLRGGQVRLAPIYDIASALPYPHLDRRRLKLAMAI